MRPDPWPPTPRPGLAPLWAHRERTTSGLQEGRPDRNTQRKLGVISVRLQMEVPMQSADKGISPKLSLQDQGVFPRGFSREGTVGT